VPSLAGVATQYAITGWSSYTIFAISKELASLTFLEANRAAVMVSSFLLVFAAHAV
jgi:hypothetical protein